MHDPNTLALRLLHGHADIAEIKPELFNHAHPDLILETLAPGAPVRITGMRARPITLAVPREMKSEDSL